MDTVFNDDVFNLDQNNPDKVAVSLIIIDNYDDVMETVEEIGRPLLTALIDRQLNTLAQYSNGIIKKFEKDKYIFIFSQNKLMHMKEKNFEVLDRIRSIDAGNQIPVTISAGIGLGGETLAKTMEYARAAIDLALGRGGDQILLKDSEKYYFYGGKSAEKESSSRVRARVKAYALTELIKESGNIIIMGHRYPDMDCLGAGIGIYKIASGYGKPCYIILNGPTPGIRLLYDRLMELPEYREIILINSETALKMTNTDTLLVIVDTHRPSFTECPELFKKTNKIVVIDHHRKCAENVDNPVLNYHEPYASSTSELITEMLQYAEINVGFEKTEADALLAGITIDTKNFALKTGAKTFEAAAYLKRYGADTTRVRLLQQSDLQSYKEKVRAVNDAEILNNNIAISVCAGEVENPSLITAQAADELLFLTGVVASFVLCKFGDVIIISARSYGEVNVQMIMEKLGGGGHQNVAGAQIKGSTIDEVKEKLKYILDLERKA